MDSGGVCAVMGGTTAMRQLSVTLWDSQEMVSLCHCSAPSAMCLCRVELNMISLFICLDALAVSYAFFGVGSGVVVATNFNCSGTESSLFNCSYNSSVSCSHSSDAGVICPTSKLVIIYTSTTIGGNFQG